MRSLKRYGCSIALYSPYRNQGDLPVRRPWIARMQRSPSRRIYCGYGIFRPD
ncbi:hypothetical protein ASZ90_016497 [hydrocarbon metagenome]|uniref:Uncharacterized protein n=1 Tax=hydrocarbon metagenome TaxID=938273 RepID=A0A0W8ER68_9ZZZZ